MGTCRDRLTVGAGDQTSHSAAVNTSAATAIRFCDKLYAALVPALRDTAAVLSRVEEVRAHATGYPETRFCKAVVLPIVDAVTTAFLHEEFGLSRTETHQALRCEGAATLRQLYIPPTLLRSAFPVPHGVRIASRYLKAARFVHPISSDFSHVLTSGLWPTLRRAVSASLVR